MVGILSLALELQRFRGRQRTSPLGPFEGRRGLGQGDGHHAHQDGQDNEQLQQKVLAREGHSSSSSHNGLPGMCGQGTGGPAPVAGRSAHRIWAQGLGWCTGNYIPKPAAGRLWDAGNVNAMNTTFSAYTRVMAVTYAPSIGTTSQPMLIRF